MELFHWKFSERHHKQLIRQITTQFCSQGQVRRDGVSISQSAGLNFNEEEKSQQFSTQPAEESSATHVFSSLQELQFSMIHLLTEEKEVQKIDK